MITNEASLLSPAGTILKDIHEAWNTNRRHFSGSVCDSVRIPGRNFQQFRYTAVKKLSKKKISVLSIVPDTDVYSFVVEGVMLF
jgi:hypothetical protein